jgi:hypothetical protein
VNMPQRALRKPSDVQVKNRMLTVRVNEKNE